MHSEDRGVIEQILELARWAPSGDNTQVWRFEIAGERHLVVHGFDTRKHCVYDFQGHASQISLGTLIENIVIAASQHRWAAHIARRAGQSADRPCFDIRFAPDSRITPSPLAMAITQRSVQRRPLRTRALTPDEKSQLEAATGPDHRIVWLEGFSNKWRTARMLFANAKIRLTMPEAYPVHRDIIQWNARFSEDRIPDQALGVDALTLRLMKWAMHSWNRLAFLNRYCAGTLMPRIQLDFIPGLACAAHFAILAPAPAENIDDFVAAGRALQRFWLTATNIGLQMQPEITPLVFASYVRASKHFSRTAGLWEQAVTVSKKLEGLLGQEGCEHAIFFGRIGAGRAAHARSLRLPLRSLMHEAKQD